MPPESAKADTNAAAVELAVEIDGRKPHFLRLRRDPFRT
jgi:hypothetical protein